MISCIMKSHADVPLKEKARVRGYEIKDWEESMETAAKIEKMSNNPDHNQLQTRAPIYQEMKQGSILILFIGLFVSLLFFIVQGSMMYLRVFTNLEDKKIQIHALHRLGLTKKEIRQIFKRRNTHPLFRSVSDRGDSCHSRLRGIKQFIGIEFVCLLGHGHRNVFSFFNCYTIK